MREASDMTGMRFGILTVVKRVGRNKHRHITWLCRCDCGVEKVMDACNIRKAKSCGCLRNKNKVVHTKHGDSRSRLYGIWKMMRCRCNPNLASKYPDYSGRGIRVCQEWDNWESFKGWALSNGYEEDLTIDRIDVNGDYEPSNCRWADRITQANNMRTNVHVTYRGNDYTIGELARAEGIKYQQLRDRIRDSGMSVEKAVELGKSGTGRTKNGN